jgi:Protein of unknown function (DUF2892)
MKKNMGTLDRIIRLLIAITIVALYYFKVIDNIAAVILLIVSAIFILTSLVGACPLYLPLGISTCKKQK